MSIGICLEDCGSYLPWGIACNDAWEVGNPRHYNDPLDQTRIVWSSKVFNGINCDLLAYLPNGVTLDSVTVSLNKNVNKNMVDSLDQYEFMKKHLSNEFGNPCEITMNDSALVMPILTWVSGKTSLQLFTGDRFGEFTLLEIIHGRKPRFGN